jgi:uncharacterized membrane protein
MVTAVGSMSVSRVKDKRAERYLHSEYDGLVLTGIGAAMAMVLGGISP